VTEKCCAIRARPAIDTTRAAGFATVEAAAPRAGHPNRWHAGCNPEITRRRIMATSHTTTNHQEIRRWIEKRGGHPAAVAATVDEDDAGILRVDFDPPDDSLEQISWDDFFNTFDEKSLAFLYQDKTADGKTSRFFKFVSRDDSDDSASDEDGDDVDDDDDVDDVDDDDDDED
jgi:hypothetical protein